MKKVTFVFVLLFVFSGLFVYAKPKLPAKLIVQPDPDNPFQGTWIALISDRVILVVEGTEWTQYNLVGMIGAEWRRIGVGKIEKRADGFYYNSEGDRWTVENNILTISGGKGQYERYVVKK